MSNVTEGVRSGRAGRLPARPGRVAAQAGPHAGGGGLVGVCPLRPVETCKIESVNGDPDRSWTPPQLRPKRKNTVLLLFDAPIYRDWTVWVTVGAGTLAGFAIGSSKSPSGIPTWANTSLAIVFFVSAFGILPAALRLQYRRWMWRRLTSRQQPPPSSTIDVPPTFTKPVTPAWQQESNMDMLAGGSRPTQGTQVPHLQNAPSTSQVLAHAQMTFQYPVALAARKLQLATSPKERYDALLDCTESLILTLGITSAAWLRSQRTGKDDLEELRQQCTRGGLSHGHWQAIIRAFAIHVIDHPHAVPGAVEGFRKLKGGFDLQTDLSTLTSERNRSAHGGRPRIDDEASLRLSECLPILERALSRAQFLTDTPWVITRFSSYQRRSGSFDVQADLAMGNHPDFVSQKFTSVSPLANDTFYALGPTGPIDLTPL